jgi:hypothetical protein
VVKHRQLPPPARTPVYELTDWGHELEPVLMGRWGSRVPARDQRQLSVDALMMALITTFDPTRAETSAIRVGVVLGEDRFTVTIRDGQLEVGREDLGPPRCHDKYRRRNPSDPGLQWWRTCATPSRRAGRGRRRRQGGRTIPHLFTLQPAVNTSDVG